MKGQNICPACGSQAGGIVQQNVNVPAAGEARQRSLEELDRMVSYFGPKEKEYDEFERLSQEVDKRSSKGYGGSIVATVIMILLGLWSKLVFFYVVAAIIAAVFVLRKINNNKKLSIAVEKCNNTHEILMNHYNNYGYCAVGFEYTRPAMLMELHSLVRQGRASTLQDAINLYIADQDKEEMLRLQKETADSAKTAAAFAAANFFFKRK